MGEFLGEFQPNKTKIDKIISLFEAKKKISEAQKILEDLSRRISLVSGKDFQNSYQLQEWFQSNMSKLKNLIE